MASLKGLLTNRNPAEMVEENLETGYIYVIMADLKMNTQLEILGTEKEDIAR